MIKTRTTLGRVYILIPVPLPSVQFAKTGTFSDLTRTLTTVTFGGSGGDFDGGIRHATTREEGKWTPVRSRNPLWTYRQGRLVKYTDR